MKIRKKQVKYLYLIFSILDGSAAVNKVNQAHKNTIRIFTFARNFQEN